jgi:hypothetical protein
MSFSRFAILPFSWRFTVFILVVIVAMIAVAVVRGDPTGYIVAGVLVVFIAPLVAVVLVNRRSIRILETHMMDHSERSALIAAYKDGYQEIYSAVQQLTEEDLDRRPADGGWTPREIVHHLADSETIGRIRLLRLMAEDHPELPGYNEELFARQLHYDRPIGASLDLLRATRSATSELLDWMTEEDWTREGIHSERGRFTVEDWLRTYAAHAHDHAEQMRGVAG